MADVFVTNTSNGSTITGNPEDRLVVTYTEETGVTLLAPSGSLATGYSGTFDGVNANDISFSGFGSFSFTSATTFGHQDNLTTGDGNDSFSTAGGNDVINSGGGIDNVDGGADIDRWGANLSSATQDIVINLNTSSTFLGTGSVVNIEGFLGMSTGSGNDTLTSTGFDTAETINSGGGNDTVSVFNQNTKTVDGGTGSDRLILTGAAETGLTMNLSGDLATGYSGAFDGVNANDVNFSGIESFTFTTTTNHGDNITTGGGNDVLSTSGGFDLIHSGAGVDVIDGGADIDRWGADLSSATQDIVINLNGSSTFLTTGSVVNVEGFLGMSTGSGNDTLTSTGFDVAETINSGGGNDTVSVFVQNTKTVDGGTGSDRLVVTGTETGVTMSVTGNLATGYSGTFDGVNANDVNFSGIENFTFTTTTSHGDNITTGGGNDVLSTGGGFDLIHSGAGIDVIDGGADIDRWGADLSSATQNIVINLNGSSTFLTTGSVVNVEGFLGMSTGSGNDTLTSTGFDVAETINSGGGNDTVSVFVQNTKTVDGGTGNDRLVVTGTQTGVTMSVTGDLATGYSGTFDGVNANDVNFSGVENFTFTTTFNHGDDITTGGGNDVLSTGGGFDNINSGAGIDVIDGGADIDRWSADMSSATQDIVIDLSTSSTFLGIGSVVNVEGFANLKTGSGNDTLTSTGFDVAETIDSGGGNDTITVFGQNNKTVAGGTGNDRLVVASTPGGVDMTVTGSLATGYSGTFDGVNANDVNFSGVENFTFTDTAGGGNTITTGDGDDVILAGGGFDNINTAGGNDLVKGGAHDDTLNGGDGVDTVDWSDATGNIVFAINASSAVGVSAAGIGNDTVSNFENVIGGSGNDTLSGTIGLAVANVLDGGGGNDTLAGGLGDDTLIGGSGFDTADFSAATGALVLTLDASGNGTASAAGIGTDTFTGIESIRTGGGDDSITGNDDDNTLIGGGGNDTLNGLAGNDTLTGQGGNDALNGGTDRDTASYAGATAGVTVSLDVGGAQNTGGAGNDTLSSIENLTGSSFGDTLTGNSGDNVLSGGNGVDTLTGANGADRLDGGIGADIMAGGNGNDTYVVDSGSDVITEGVGFGIDTVESSVTHTLAANVDNLTLTGTAGTNATGNAQVNTITGNSGVNRIDGGGSADTMAGANGNDTYVVDSVGDTITELAGAGIDTVESSVTYTLAANVDKLTLTGSAGTNATGNNLVNTITGNSAANRIDGGGAADTMIGGNGNDTYVVDSTSDTITEGAGFGIDTVESSVSYTLAANVDKLTLTGSAGTNGTGNAQVNTIIGNSGSNRIDGGGAADTMIGGNGNDTYVVDSTSDVVTEASGAGTGVDSVESSVSHTLAANVEKLTLTGSAGTNGTGNAGANTIIGNSGANRIDGDALSDTLTGGTGNDDFVFDDGDGADTVTDFQNGNDQFDLSAVAGVNNIGDLTIIDNGSTVTVNYGSGSFTIANLADPAQLDASDFIF